jgi:HD-like signal output (HDOD) protein
MMLHKVAEKRRLHNLIKEHLLGSPELRPFPTAVTRLVTACCDPESTNRDLAQAIEYDPALAVKILRLANSPLVCPRGSVKSIVHAVSMLGRRKLKSVAMSVATASMFSSGDQHGAAHRQSLWNHSLGCASVATVLAPFVPDVDPPDAMLAGVFHDVGKLLFLDAIPDEYQELTESLHGGSIVEEEQFLFGTTHEEIGVRSANSWGLSKEIVAAIGWHHRPDDAPFCQNISSTVALADNLARQWGLGLDPACNGANSHLLERFDLSEQVLEQVEGMARGAFEQLTADLSS